MLIDGNNSRMWRSWLNRTRLKNVYPSGKHRGFDSHHPDLLLKNILEVILNKHLFFWGGVFSNFHPINGNQAFTSEKIYMAAKALCFRDSKALTAINNSVTPREAKAIGRTIVGFDNGVWDAIKIDAMNFALQIKFDACEEFRDALRASGNLMLVEASPVDRIWGIGFDRINALANIDKWGENLLGRCLMGLRHKHFGT